MVSLLRFKYKEVPTTTKVTRRRKKARMFILGRLLLSNFIIPGTLKAYSFSKLKKNSFLKSINKIISVEIINSDTLEIYQIDRALVGFKNRFYCLVFDFCTLIKNYGFISLINLGPMS